MAVSFGKVMGVVALLALVAGWPSIQSAKAQWSAERERKSADTRAKIQDYVKMRDELGMPSPFPPEDMMARQKAEAQRLGGGGSKSVFEGTVSALGPSYLEVEASVSGVERCRDSVKALGSSKDARVRVNGRTVHRKEAWKLCGAGANNIRVVRE